VFAVHGAVMGSFGARIPWLQDRLELRPAALGLALLMPAVGALSAMPFAGRFVHRLGGRRATTVLLALWCAAVAVPMFAPNVPLLCVAMFVYGASAGTADIAMNAQAVATERALGRSVMSSRHGRWSGGGLGGSGVGALAAHAELDARLHLAAVALVLGVAGLGACAGLLDTRDDQPDEPPPAFAMPSRAVLAIGLVMFCALFGEVATSDWCAVYLRTELHTDPGVAAGAFAAFSLAMAVSRLAGDAVVARLGPVRTVRVSTIVAAAGGALVVVAGSAPMALAAFGLIGLGIATVVPLSFSAAGHASAHPGHAIAGVATVAYGAGFAAPSTVGAIADVSSLRVSFLLVAAMIGVVAVAAGVLRERSPDRAMAVPTEGER
jgi:fucose permease